MRSIWILAAACGMAGGCIEKPGEVKQATMRVEKNIWGSSAEVSSDANGKGIMVERTSKDGTKVMFKAEELNSNASAANASIAPLMQIYADLYKNYTAGKLEEQRMAGGVITEIAGMAVPLVGQSIAGHYQAKVNQPGRMNELLQLAGSGKVDMAAILSMLSADDVAAWQAMLARLANTQTPALPVVANPGIQPNP